MAYKVTTKVGKKKFVRIFKTVKSVDKYLKGAMKLKKKYPNADKATFTINGTKVSRFPKK